MLECKLSELDKDTREHYEEHFNYPCGKFNDIHLVVCDYCKQPLKYQSISYYEGFHIDGCNEI